MTITLDIRPETQDELARQAARYRPDSATGAAECPSRVVTVVTFHQGDIGPFSLSIVASAVSCKTQARRGPWSKRTLS